MIVNILEAHVNKEESFKFYVKLFLNVFYFLLGRGLCAEEKTINKNEACPIMILLIFSLLLYVMLFHKKNKYRTLYRRRIF